MRVKRKLAVILIGIFFVCFYLYYQTKSIYGGDAGDLVSAASLFGISHPPGFPVYTLLAGILIKLIPFYTPAWRVGLLSSLPSVGTLLVFFIFVRKITKDTLISLIGTFILGFSYLFWLYSEVPEVFSINSFFSLLLLLILFVWQKNPQKISLIYSFAVIFGLAVAHHQIILFLTPAFGYFFWLNKKYLLNNKGIILRSLIISLLTLIISYIYVVVATLRAPLINWGNPVNLVNLFNLISRQTYGTFQSGAVMFTSPSDRFSDVLLLFNFFNLDFTIIGILLGILGLYHLLRLDKKIALYLLIAFLFSGPFFQFYAGYPTINSFGLAIFERFLIVPEIIYSLFITIGVWFIAKKLKFFKYILLTLPLVFLYFNLPKITILKNDFSAENLGIDILNTVEPNGILVLAGDTPLFDSQYVYYALKQRKNIYLFHFLMLDTDYYPEIIRKNYPELIVPKIDKKYDFIIPFLKANSVKHQIYTNFLNDNLPGDFIPKGMLLRYYPNKVNYQTASKTKENNRKVWESYHNPLSSSLKEYKNLMLSDTLNPYLIGGRETAQSFFNSGEYNKSLYYFKLMENYDPDSFTTDYDLGKVYLALKDCKNAEKYYLKAIVNGPEVPDAYLGLSKVYGSCLHNKAKSSVYQNLYLEKKKAIETPLEKL